MKLYTHPYPIIESTFEKLRHKQIKDKESLVDLLCKTDKLPSELWIHIVSFINNDDEYDAYFMFLRYDIGWQDTYYFFRGTKVSFDKAMSNMRKTVLEIQDGSRAIEDDLLDTPIDTYCPRDLYFNNRCDNDGKCLNNVNKCCCQWEYYVYDNYEELRVHYIDIVNANFTRCEIAFI